MRTSNRQSSGEPGSDPRLLVNILGNSRMSLDDDNLAALKFLASVKQKKKRGVGKTRVKLAKIVSDSLGIDCQPEDLQPASGANRTNKSLDTYAWEVFARHRDSDVAFVAGCFETMGECVKAGKVYLIKGEIYTVANQPSRGGKREGAGRKVAPEGTAKVPYGTKLTPEVVEYLRQCKNAAKELDDMVRRSKQFREWSKSR